MNFFSKIKIHQVVISLLIGFAAGASFGKCNLEKYTMPWQAKGPGHMREKMLNRLSKELHLSNEQKQQVKMIFERHHPEMKALHDEMRPKFEALRNQTHAEIQSILNEKQQVKFQALNAKWDEKMEKRRAYFEGEAKP